MMKKALQVKYKTFINFKSFAVIPRSLKFETLAFPKATSFGFKRLLSNSATPISSICSDKKHKKVKGSMGSSHDSDKGFVKEIGVESKVVEIQSIRDDMRKLEAMTVQQLRATLRSKRIPAKGCKRDLVSTLKSFVEEIDGESSIAVDKEVSSVSAEDRPVKRKAKNLTHEDNVQGITVEDETIKVDAKIFTKKQKLSISTDELPGSKPRSKKKVVSDVRSDVTNADVGIKLPMIQTEPWTVLAHKKPQKGWIPYNPRTMRPPPLSTNSKFVKLMSWNVNGLRALLKLEEFSALEIAQRENFDVLCFQETKLQEKDVEKVKQCFIDGYDNSFWTCSVSKLGYSGTAIVSRIKPLSVRYGLGISDHDTEGRLVTVEFDSFYLLCTYVPNSGDGLKRLSYRVEQWDLSLSSYMKELEKSKPVILTGDLNCAHKEIDIYDPAGNKRSAGFTEEERQSFETNFLSKGFVDTFRKQHPDVLGYTYWGYRHGGRKTNKGWRLDYFLVSESIADNVHDSYILPDVTGSDHCPIGLTLKL